jgi:hypothetical protein
LHAAQKHEQFGIQQAASRRCDHRGRGGRAIEGTDAAVHGGRCWHAGQRQVIIQPFNGRFRLRGPVFSSSSPLKNSLISQPHLLSEDQQRAFPTLIRYTLRVLLEQLVERGERKLPLGLLNSRRHPGEPLFCPVAGELLFLQPTGHVTLLHPVARLARVALVVADFKGIRDG